MVDLLKRYSRANAAAGGTSAPTPPPKKLFRRGQKPKVPTAQRQTTGKRKRTTLKNAKEPAIKEESESEEEIKGDSEDDVEGLLFTAPDSKKMKTNKTEKEYLSEKRDMKYPTELKLTANR